MVKSTLVNYSTLLTIRQAAARRDTTILGGVFAVLFIATIALGMLDHISGRSLYLVTALLVILGFACLSAWVKSQIINNSVELISMLQAMIEEHDDEKKR